ncbi:MAG: zf-HC2 domain-containing protein [Thermoguttaceae bacterium]|jgi:hypothetical protein
MKPARLCKDRWEDIVALVMGELDAPAARELEEHLAVCEACRMSRDALIDEEKVIRSGFEELARRLELIERSVSAQEGCQSSVRFGVSNNHFSERVKSMIRAHKRLIAAAATLAALAAGLIVYVVVVSSTRPAYAMEQTAAANSQIKTCHVRCSGGGVGEAWIELNADGTPYRARLDFPKTEDGAKVVILTADKAEVWFKDKKGHAFVTEKNALARIAEMQKQFDPKAAFEELQAMKAGGKAEVATQEPAKTGDPITLTVTRKDRPNQRAVYTVDANTKLVQRMTIHTKHDSGWEQVGLIDYLDYNKEIDPSVFRLDIPADVVTVDQINQKIGLEQGDLTKEEIATKVAREFFAALIAEDYAKAGLLLEGMPAEKMKEMFGGAKFLRIVEVGKPLAGKHPDPTALQVPIKVEWQDAGSKTATKSVKQFAPYVRPVYGHPDRWGICGGI